MTSPPSAAAPAMIALRRVMSLVVMLFADGHGAHLAFEPGENDHEYVNDQKQREQKREDEMNGARGLKAAKGAGNEWVRRGDSRGHCQTSDAGERQRNKDHDEVGEFLEQTILRTAGRRSNFETQMLFEIGPKTLRRKFVFSRQKIASEVAGNNTRKEIGNAGQNENPRGQEMKTSSPAILIV